MEFEQIDELRVLQPNKFLQSAAKIYGMSTDALKALMEDYDLCPRGSMGPSD